MAAAWRMDARRVSGFILMGLGVVVGLVGVVSALASLGRAEGAWLVSLGIARVLLALLLPLVLVRIGHRLAFPRRNEPPAPRVRPVPPVPEPALEDLAALPMPVLACPDCGFLGVRTPQMRDGLWPGGGELGDRKVCGRCGYQGLVPTFDSPASYGAFVRGLQTGDAA